jgi:hypothetical protein
MFYSLAKVSMNMRTHLLRWKPSSQDMVERFDFQYAGYDVEFEVEFMTPPENLETPISGAFLVGFHALG